MSIKFDEMGIIELNKLVDSLDIAEQDMSYMARSCRLQYTPEVFQRISKYCTVDKMMEVIYKLSPSCALDIRNINNEYYKVGYATKTYFTSRIGMDLHSSVFQIFRHVLERSDY